MNPVRAIELLKRLFEVCPGEPRWIERGKFEIVAGVNGVDRSLLEDLENEEVFYSIHPDRVPKPSLVEAGTKIIIDSACSVNRIVLVPDVASLIEVPKARRQVPAAYVVWHQGKPVFHVNGESTQDLPEPLPSYHQAVDLWNLLKGFCHHPDKTTDSLWFFGIRKTEITPHFTITDLQPPLDIKAVSAFMEPSDARETRKDILVSRVTQHLKDMTPEKRFSFLLSSIEVFARGLNEAMNIYLCEHSPEKLADEAAKYAMDFTEKVEKIVSALEAKSLAIPAAIWLAYKDIQANDSLGNFMIILASLLFALFMGWIWQTQSTLLDILHDSMKQKKQEFQDKGLDKSNPLLAVTFTKLIDRASTSERYAGWMAIFACIPIVVSLSKWIFSA
jgi:hypothetical protein